MRNALFILLCVYLLSAHGAENDTVPVDTPIGIPMEESNPNSEITRDTDQVEAAPLPPVQFKDNSKIVVETTATEIGNLLATEIKNSLGWTLEIGEAVPPDGHYIHLTLACDEMPRDGFIHTSENDRSITLCASEISGLRFAVYDFAERWLGVRWLFPAPDDLGTYRPVSDTLFVSRENRAHAPAYINRRFSHGQVDQHYADWADHMRMTTSESAFHHNLYNLFPPSQYRLTRPGFYPVHTNGIRYPETKYVGQCETDRSLCKEENHRWQPVLTAEGITDEAVKNIRTYFDERPDTDWYSLGMNDSLVWGKAQQQGKPLNSLGFTHMSDYFFPWVNGVVEQVGKTHPRARFGLLAYNNLVDPPADRLNDQVVPYIAYDRMQWADPARRIKDRTRTETWSSRTRELGWYDYVYGDQERKGGPEVFYSAPRVYPHLMAEYLRFGRDQGVRHYYAEAYPSSEYWREGPKLYVLAKLLWDPDLDVDALLKDWYQAAVGEGATFLSNYYARWETFWTERIPETQWFKSTSRGYLYFPSSEYLSALTIEDQTYFQTHMDGLKKSTRGTEFEERADFFLKAWDEVNKQAFGPQFDFAQGVIPKGYKPVFEDSLERVEGNIHNTWSFWNRPDVGSKVESGLSADHASDGKKSIAIRLKATGKDEAYAVLYRSAEVSAHKKFCLKAQVRSPGNSHTLTLTFKRDGETTQAHKKEQSFSTTTGWQTSALCTELPANDDFVEVRAWLGVKTKAPGAFQAWFDDIALYSKP